MPKIDITALDRELRSETLRPCYAITGEEHYLVKTAISLIKDKILGKSGESDFGLHTFVGSDAKVEAVLGALCTVSFLAVRTLVIIRDADKLKKELMESLVDYLSRPADTAFLLFSGTRLDGRSKLMQQISKIGAVIECKPLYANKIPSWINLEVKRRGLQISQQAAGFLADMVGGDLSQILQSIDRLVLYVGDRKLIELSDVEESIAETHQRTIFELTDAVGERKISRAIFLLNNILEHGTSPVLALNMLARHFRILSKAREIGGRLGDNAQTAKYLGVHPFYLQNYMKQAGNFSGGELCAAFRKLHACDRNIKSSRIPPKRAIERALFAIIQK